MSRSPFIQSARYLPAVSRSKSKGFTIVELLVAVGVTTLLVSLMLGIVVNITKAWNRSSGSLEGGNQARMVLDQMASDLQAAIMRRDNNIWLAATIQQASSPDWEGAAYNTANIPTTTSPLPSLEEYRFGPYGVWLRFFTTVPDENATVDDPSTPGVDERLSTLSAPRAVAYQIVRLPVVVGSSEIRYQMFRSEVPPHVTFAQGYDLLGASYTTTDTNGSLAVRRPNRTTDLIANNVVDFGVRILGENDAVLFPRSATDEFLATATAPSGGEGANIGFPKAIEIFIRVLSAEGADELALLENPPDGYTPPEAMSAAKWDEIMAAHSRVYTRRVNLPATAF